MIERRAAGAIDLEVNQRKDDGDNGWDHMSHMT